MGGIQRITFNPDNLYDPIIVDVANLQPTRFRKYLMMNNKQHWKLIVRYVAGECSEREAAEVRALIAIDEQKGKLYDEVRELWELSQSGIARENAEGAWQNLNQRIQRNPEVISLADARAAYRRSRGRGGLRRTVSIAAVLAIVVVSAIVAVQLTPDELINVRNADYEVYTARRGEHTSVPLPDGSVVLLNADSRLTVPSTFGSETRDVYLEGQAYFEVESSAGLPFTVQTELANVRVMGTTFDVDAYPEMDQMQVVVASGEVRVQSNREKEDRALVLKPRDIGLVLGTGEQIVRRDVDVRRFFAWKEGRLHFENADFEDVARSLERWYDLEIDLTQKSHKPDGLTASFRDEPVDEVLGVVSMALNLNYERHGRRVLFYPASRSKTTTRIPSDT